MISCIKKHWQGLVISILVAELVGIMSSFLSGDVKSIYQDLFKPPFAPPDWLFGIVWPIMYLLMGIAAYLVYASSADEKEKKTALILYSIQLALNFIWSIVFFRFGLHWCAFGIILLLDAFVVATIKEFCKISKVSAKLMMVYLLWLLYATYLNLGIAFLN